MSQNFSSAAIVIGALRVKVYMCKGLETCKRLHKYCNGFQNITHKCILTSTKNASLIITDFLAMIKEKEQRRTASLCSGWAMLENDFNLICR